MTDSASSFRAGALAEYLLDLRNGRQAPPQKVPDHLTPPDLPSALTAQMQVAHSLGPVAGWKVGASSPEAEPSAAPLHASTIFEDGAIIPADLCRHRGVEGEIAWKFAGTVDGPAETITPEQVLAAIGTVHPVIELVDTRFAEPASQAPLLHLADQQSHGALIVGAAVPEWKTKNPFSGTVSVRLDHRQAVYQAVRNAGGEPLRLLLWLAKHAAMQGMPLTPGTIVTTGSLTGTCFVPHRTHVTVTFDESAQVSCFLA